MGFDDRATWRSSASTPGPRTHLRDFLGWISDRLMSVASNRTLTEVYGVRLIPDSNRRTLNSNSAVTVFREYG